jgi:hypothetical protein
MTHDSAVRTVVSLVPEIEKRGAEAVLTEYANREDLPPAQLEKLAQVYNTLRQVSHIDNADADARGATVPMVDVPTLVVGYATGIGQEKVAAGPHSFSTHDLRTVDLNRAMRFELGTLSKAAAEVTGQPAQVGGMFDRAEMVEKVAGALIELEVDLEDEMSKLASEIFAAAPRVDDSHFCRDISEFEEEALQYQPALAVKAAGDFMEKFAAPHRTKLSRFAFDRQVPQRAYDIGHALGQKFAELAKAAGTLDVIIKLAAHATIPPGAGLPPDNEQVVDQMLSGLFSTPTFNRDAEDPNISAVTQAAKAKAEADAAAGGQPADVSSALSAAEAVSTEGRPAAGGGGPPRRDDRPPKEGGPGSTEKTKDGTKHSLIEMLSIPIKATTSAIQSTNEKAQTLIRDITTKPRKNTAQRDTDLSVDDIRRAMAIRRLIGTDPVLKDADPKAVLEVYNSVVARNPQLAGDMAALRLILREAVSYEGLTLDSQKLLSEIRRNSEQAEEAATTNENARYAVGGSILPTVSKSK